MAASAHAQPTLPNPNGFAIGAPVPPAQLARIADLPVKPTPISLRRGEVSLTPTILAHAPALHAVSNGDAITLGHRHIPAYDPDTWIWRYLRYGPFADADALAEYLVWLDNHPDLRAFTLFDPATDHPVGVMAIMANSPAHLKVELGHIWVAPVMQGSGLIYAAASLLLEHLFGLGYRRVEWKCDALNTRSRRTALGIGFSFEGIQEYHMIVRGHNRDTAWFRLLDHEWPDRRARLDARLGGTVQA